MPTKRPLVVVGIQVLSGLLTSDPSAVLAATQTRNYSSLPPAVTRVLTEKKRQLGITSVRNDGNKLTLIKEGFDAIPVAQFWVSSLVPSLFAFMEYHDKGHTLTYHEEDHASSTYRVDDSVMFPGSLLLHSPNAEDPRHPYRLINEDDPFVYMGPDISKPIKMGNALFFSTEKGNMLVPQSNPYNETTLFEGNPTERNGCWELQCKGGGYALVLQDNVAVSSPRLKAPPQSVGDEWMGQAELGTELMVFRKSDLQKVHSFSSLERDFGKSVAVKMGGAHRIIPKGDWEKLSPPLDSLDFEVVGSNWQAGVKGALESILIQQNDARNYSRPFSTQFRFEHWDYGSAYFVEKSGEGNSHIFKDSLSMAGRRGKEEKKNMRQIMSERKGREHPVGFFVQKDNPARNSPDFIDLPHVNEHSFFVQIGPRTWTFLDKVDPQLTSIDIEADASIEDMDDVWAIRHRKDRFQLLEKENIQVHTDMLHGMPKDLGRSIQVADAQGLHYLVLKTDIKVKSRPFAEASFDFGQSLLVRNPGPGGLYRLLLKEKPTAESIPFRRVLEGKPGPLARLGLGRASAKIAMPPARILVEDEQGNAVWISTTTLAVAAEPPQR